MTHAEYDLVVIGSGPSGEKAAIEAARRHKTVAIVERRSVQGGVCLHTGTIPSPACVSVQSTDSFRRHFPT
jgi:NAD(P) transhydrogenase